MTRALLGLVLLACAGLLSDSDAASVSPTVLTFEDVATSPWVAVMPTGYGGLSWENFYVADGNYPPFYNSGFRNGIVSPPKTAFNGAADPATIRSSTSFSFIEAYFAVAYSQTTEPSQVQIDGYFGNTLKYSRQVIAVTSGPTLATLNYNGIDRLVFTSLVNPGDGRRSQFVIDNFTYSFDSVQPPTLSGLEPTSILAGSQGFTLRVSGANFASGAMAQWNGSNLATSLINNSRLEAIVPASNIVAPGSASITVFNPDSAGASSNSLPFTISPPGYEADVSPRPDGSNNGAVTIADWTQVGRFVAGLDVVAPGAEFQRADCAPRASLGDGRLTIADWVQAGRYATGLDPVIVGGGPIGTGASLQPAIGGRLQLLERQASQAARVVKAKWQSGQNGALAIELDALGNENALGFSLSFDPQQLSFISAAVGLDASEATLHVNETESASGRVGLALALPAGRALAEGLNQIVIIRFGPTLNERGARALVDRRERFRGIKFGDYPVRREAADIEACVLPAAFSFPR